MNSTTLFLVLEAGDLAIGDLLAVAATGAYCYAMSTGSLKEL